MCLRNYWLAAAFAAASSPLLAQQSGGDPKSSTPAKNVADAAKSILDRRAAELSKSGKLKQEAAKNPGPTVSAQQALVKSGTNSIELPKSWKEISASRAKIAGHRLTEKEAALLKALNTEFKVDFDKTRFQDVLKFLSDKTGQQIVVPPSTLDEADITYDTPVTLKVAKPAPLHALLRRVLRDHGLTYVIRDEGIQVVTPERAGEMMIVRVHQVADICGPPRSLRTLLNANHLMLIIQAMIGSEWWDVNGGPATIAYNNDTATMTIRAPAELHLRMGTSAYGPAGK